MSEYCFSYSDLTETPIEPSKDLCDHCLQPLGGDVRKCRKAIGIAKDTTPEIENACKTANDNFATKHERYYRLLLIQSFKAASDEARKNGLSEDEICGIVNELQVHTGVLGNEGFRNKYKPIRE